MKMKKVLSWLISCSMISTMFVSFAAGVHAADYTPTITTTVEEMDDAAFNELLGESIPAGYDAYLVKFSATDFGEITAVKQGLNNINGRRIASFSPRISFDSVDSINKDYTAVLSTIIEGSSGFDGNSYQVGNTATAKTAYPSTAGETYTSLEDAVVILFTVAEGVTIKGSVEKFEMKINTYTSGTPSNAEVYNSIFGQVNLVGDTFTFGESEPEPQPAVNSVTIDQGDDPITVEGGQTLQLIATVDAVNGADDTVTWSIDPETPATISPDGLFTAPEATEVDQVFTVKATSTFDGSKSDSIEITVPKKEVPQPQQPTTDITGAAVEKGVYFDVTMNGNGEAITDANVVVAGPTADGEGKEVTFKVIGYGDIEGELSFIIGILTDIAGEYTGTSNVTTGVGTATDSATVAFPAQ